VGRSQIEGCDGLAVEIEPPELAQLLDFAERPRVDDWSLRAALTRYAQPQAQRVGDLLEQVRRLEFALRPVLKLAAKDGPGLWQAFTTAPDDAARADPALGLLHATAEVDRLGDALAAWAADPSGDRPDAEVDRVTADLGQRLDALGVAREERRPPRARRGGL
jgi:hypothetical protein